MCSEGDVILGVGNLTEFHTSINELEAELKCVLEGYMKQYVMMTGTLRMRLLSASNLDSRPMAFFTWNRLAGDLFTLTI